MAWVLLENFLDRLPELVEKGIPTVQATITKPHRVEGLAFPDENTTQVCKMLGIDQKKYKTVNTDTADILLLLPKNHKPPKPMRILKGDGPEKDANLQDWDKMLPILQKYAEILDTKITVSNPHGKERPIQTADDTLFIRFWSVPTHTEGYSLRSCFGILLSRGGQSDALHPTGTGSQIVDDDGNIVAEYHPTTLYILFDLPHGGDVAEILDAILGRAVPIIKNLPKEEIEALLARQRIEEQNRIKEDYIKECLKRRTNVEDQVKGEISKTREELSKITTKMVELTRFLDEKELILTSLSKIADDRDVLAEEFDRLCNLPHVKKVLIQEGVLLVYTDTIFLPYKGKTYEIGDFRIELRSNWEPVLFNTRVREITGQGTVHHPHVFEDGKPCFGNIREGIARLVGGYEYAVAVQVLIEFLLSLRDSPSYIERLLQYWKPVKEEVKDKKTRKKVA